ncbi:hypothetical protein DFH11DRAFT_1548162 [Phellopilus nigrolimitatus]|nr:hypothetical protein DFH11DRAFT_1548162 [Phellopilus nigrolimitatus]
MARGRPRTTRTSSKSQSPVKPPTSPSKSEPMETIVLSSDNDNANPSPKKTGRKGKKAVLSPEFVPSEEDVNEPVPSSPPVTPKTPKRGRKQSMAEAQGREFPPSPSPVKKRKISQVSQVSPGGPVQDDDEVQALKDTRRKSSGTVQKKARFHDDDDGDQEGEEIDDRREDDDNEDDQDGEHDEEQEDNAEEEANGDEGFELVDDQAQDSKEEGSDDDEQEEGQEDMEEPVPQSSENIKSRKTGSPAKTSSWPYKPTSLVSRALAEGAANVIKVPRSASKTGGKQPRPRPAFNLVKEEETEVQLPHTRSSVNTTVKEDDKGKGKAKAVNSLPVKSRMPDDEVPLSEEDLSMMRRLKAQLKKKEKMPVIEHEDEGVKNLFEAFRASLLQPEKEKDVSPLESSFELDKKAIESKTPTSAFPRPEDPYTESDDVQSEPEVPSGDGDGKNEQAESSTNAEDEEEDSTRRKTFVTKEDENYDGELLDSMFRPRDKENLIATLPPMRQILCNSWDGKAHDNTGCYMNDLQRNLFNAQYFRFLVGYEGVGSLLNPFYASPEEVGTMQVANQTCLAIRRHGVQQRLALCGCVARVVSSNLAGLPTNAPLARKSCNVNFPSMFFDRMQSLFHAAWLRVHPPFRAQILSNWIGVELGTMMDRRTSTPAASTSSAPSTPKTPRRSKPVAVEYQDSKDGTPVAKSGQSSAPQVSLPFSANVPVYDGRKLHLDFTTDRPYGRLPQFLGDLKPDFPVFIAFHVHSYKNKEGHEFLSFDIQWVVVLDCRPVHTSRLYDP